jgi:Na+/citrate or Na+/malate symporter
VLSEPLVRNGTHNPVVPPLLGAGDIEKTASSIIASWTVFTELLPGNALIKSVTVFCKKKTFFRTTNQSTIEIR